MADLISDGKVKVAWVATLANQDAPTVAELTGGKDWTARLTPDGLKTDPTTADVDTSSLASTFDTSQPGRTGYVCELTFKRGDNPTDDEPFTTLKKHTTGFVVVRRGVTYTTAFAAGDIVEVYPVACGEPQHIAPAKNEVLKFMSPMKLTSDPSTDATVAA